MCIVCDAVQKDKRGHDGYVVTHVPPIYKIYKTTRVYTDKNVVSLVL